MKVVVHQPPIFSVRPASLYVRRVGNNVKMHCAAEAESFAHQNPLVVTWFKVNYCAFSESLFSETLF